MTLFKVIVLSRFLGNDKTFKDLIQKFGLPYQFYFFFTGDIKKKFEKKSFENDQLTGHFQSFFIYF